MFVLNILVFVLNILVSMLDILVFALNTLKLRVECSQNPTPERLLGIVVNFRDEFQGHQVLIIELSISRKSLLLSAVDAEAE